MIEVEGFLSGKQPQLVGMYRLPPCTKKNARQIVAILGVIRSVLVLPPISATVAALAANAALVPGVRFGEERRSPNPYKGGTCGFALGKCPGSCKDLKM